MRRFFVRRESISSGEATLKGSDVRHIMRVLRLGPGDELLLFDGEGLEYLARIREATPQRVVLSILREYTVDLESPLKITVGQALLKARKMDRVVRQLTELGVHVFIPFVAERSVARPSHARMKEKLRRWETITRESVKQCGRCQTLSLAPMVSFSHVISSAQSYDLRIIFHDAGGEAPSERLWNTPGHVKKVLALIGPEGGFTNEEIQRAVHAGFSCHLLGPRTLKADTAAVTAGVVLQQAFGDL